MGRRSRGIAVALAVFAAFAPAPEVRAQAAPHVPVADPAYQDLAVLVTRGFVRDLRFGERPHSRFMFARAAREARHRLGSEGRAVTSRVTEALERLERTFAPELAVVTAPAADSVEALPSAFVLRSASADLAWADSPDRPIVSRYEGEEDRIEATLNPLRQRNRGVVLGEGATAGGEATVDGTLGRRFAAQVSPRVWVAEGADGSVSPEATLRRAYVRGVFGNLALKVGRDDLAHGHAEVYGPVFSGAARGFDMVRVSMERPSRLPWIFRYLGPISAALTVADMGGDREFPHSKLFVYEGTIRPHPNLELGGALLNHQMGEGAPDATFGERLRDLLFLEDRRFLPFDPVPPISDKVLAGDVRLTLPGVGTELYVEFMTTDDHNLFSSVETGLGTEAAWTLGFRTLALGGDGRLDLWAETGRNGVRPYTHHTFVSGLTLDRRVFGSPLGPLATGFTGGLDWNGPDDRVSWSGAWERYQGDEYDDDPSPGTDWIKVADNPDEVRLRTSVAWERQPASPGTRTTVELGYEHVTRFDFTDETRHNFLIRVDVAYAR